MKYYKDTANTNPNINGIHHLDESDWGDKFPPGWPTTCVLITDAEGQAIEAAWLAAQAAATALLPNPLGFEQAVKTAMGGIIGANTLMVVYPAFMPALEQGVWADLQALIIDAKAKVVVTTTQYAAIKAAAMQFNIPVTL